MEDEKLAGVSENNARSGRVHSRPRPDRNRESNDQISQLKAELRRAYARKELEAQVASRRADRFVESAREREEAKRSDREHLAMKEASQRQLELSRRKCEDYGRCLEEQMTMKEERKRVAREEARREREALEEEERIKEEREESEMLRNKAELMEKLRRERLIFQEMKEIRRQEELEREERKRVEDLEYLMDVEKRAKEMKRLRDEHQDRRERVMLELARTMLSAEASRREREVLLLDLMAEELKCELLVREAEEGARRGRMRAELASGLEEQIAFAERCKLRFVEQDREFARELMEKIMEDQRTAALTVMARKRVQLRYREDLKRLMQERARIREEEMRRMEETVEHRKREEERRMERIMEERRKLVAEHAANVAGFVKKDVLTEEECRLIESLAIEDGAAGTSTET